MIVLFLACVAGAFYAGRYTVYQANPGLAAQEKATAILSKVGKLIQLPQGETPSMAAITDATAVRKAQPFLAKAENDDVLIVYQSAQTAILYRPSTNKLIAVGPVTAATNAEQSASVPVAQPVISTHTASSSKETNTKNDTSSTTNR